METARAQGGSRSPGSQLRPYQVEALDALDAGWREGRRRAWVVMPPGAGKTLVGLEAARRIGRKTVVFVPNTAIQGQWVRQWRALEDGRTAGTGRDLADDVNVLTYQSLAVFDPDAETDEEGHDRVAGRPGAGLLQRLHSNGTEMVERMGEAGPLTLILDECHHLLDVWGKLLAAVLRELRGELVIGLTGTPPESLTKAEAKLVDALFREPIAGTSVPALVREGYLAPFAELAYLVEPTAPEAEYVGSETRRFTELTTDLLAPGFAGTDFLPWLDARFAGTPWGHLAKDEPELAAAALRLCHVGLLAPPKGARLREEHRHAPTADNWIALLGDYLKHCLLPSGDDRDQEAMEAIRRALPSVGYQLTRRGIRKGRSPVDRVLARSAAKTDAAVEIAAAEAASLGERLRGLVLCDHERATATLPARLRGVLAAEAGSASLMLERLISDPRTRELAPMMVTGRTVAAGPLTARHFADWAAGKGLELTAEDGETGAAVPIEGSWSSRTWVGLVTEYFAQGHCRVLVGTRALLGEGWDAPAVNSLIDVTTATTATAVVQTRGRALRLNPGWPEKAANNWTVVCVTEDHPKGAADWDRFVRKHEGYLAATAEGEIVSGVAHVDVEFSPYAPPPSAQIDKINISMVERARNRPAIREAWRLGSGFRDELVHTIRVRPDRTPVAPAAAPTLEGTRPEPPALVPAGACAHPAPGTRLRAPKPPLIWAAVLAAPAAVTALYVPWPAAVLAAAAAALVLVAGLRVRRTRREVRRCADRLDGLTAAPEISMFAYAVAEAKTGGRGARAVRTRAEPDGSSELYLSGVDMETSRLFTEALDDLISPIATPRYLIPRYVLRGRTGTERLDRARAWIEGRAEADGVVYHAVPAAFERNARLRRIFAGAWTRWISAGEPVSTSEPEGAGIMATHAGESPLDATTVLRVSWE